MGIFLDPEVLIQEAIRKKKARGKKKQLDHSRGRSSKRFVLLDDMGVIDELLKEHGRKRAKKGYGGLTPPLGPPYVGGTRVDHGYLVRQTSVISLTYFFWRSGKC